MQFTRRQRLLKGEWRPLLVAGAVGLLLGFAGPFGSYPAFPTAIRYAFWLGLTVAGVAAVIAADAIMPRTRLPAGLMRIGGVAVLSALPMTFVVAWTFSQVQPGRVFGLQQLPALFMAVAAVQLLISYAISITAPPEIRAPVPDPSDDTAAPAFPPALLSRLPREVGSAIIALETDDHYLRVHAAGDSALVLMRMADAVAMIDPRLGTQIHRRWWVARAAVTGMRTEGQRLFLCLADERLVPVGRTFVPAVRAAFGKASSPYG
ncbi:LytTR family DNA-binding domain-containing protein [Sphingomonas xanthus]|nr:LytTR family DNA-binding domain-containing protein [Sphingomonas xanthus]